MTPFIKWVYRRSVALLLTVGATQMSLFPSALAEITIWTGGMDGFHIDWRVDGLNVTRAGTQVISFAKVAAREWIVVRRHAAGRKVTLEKTYAVLADVGPWLSVQEGSFCDCGGAHPSATENFRAYDLRASRVDRGAPAELSQIFPPDVILAALLRNEYVASTLKDAGATPPRTLPDLLRVLAFQTIRVGDCSYVFDDSLLSSFAFHHVEGDKVAIHFGLPPEAEVCRDKLAQVEVLLPVPKELDPSLRAAESGKGGLLMVKAEVIGANRTTTFTFSSQSVRHNP